MDPGVDLVAELAAGRLQLGERAGTRSQQVRLRRHQIGLRDPHRGLRPALGLRIGRHARADRHPVVPADLDHFRMPHRDPGDVLGGHGLLVVGQRIGRHPAEPAQRRIQAADHRRQRLVQDRQHHPEPRPGQPRAPQLRPPARDPRPSPQSHCSHSPGSGDPRPEHPPMPGPIRVLRRGHRPAGRAFTTREPHRQQPFVDHIRADPAVRALHQLLDLRQELVDRFRPRLPAHPADCPPPAAAHTGAPCGGHTRPTRPPPGNYP